MAYSIHGHISCILEVNFQRPIRKKRKEIENKVNYVEEIEWLPFFGPSVVSHQFFLKLRMVLGSHILLCMTELDFFKKIFQPQKLGKWAKNRVFLNLLENLVINFFSVWSKKKLYNICCTLAQITYLGKILFLRYGPKCS